MLEALGFGPERVVFHTTDEISLFPKLFVPCWPSGDKTAPMSGLAEIYQRAAATPVPEPHHSRTPWTLSLDKVNERWIG